jgi:phenylalanyl-tRNA synthetase beta chain
MLVSLHWIKDLLPLTEDAETLAKQLTMAGVEVEGVHRPGGNSRGVLVAEVRTAEPIPGKNLQRLTVFDGAERTVICGDTTIKAGERVAYAPPGATAGGREMGARKFGDVESAGMLCSLSDLGLEEKSDGVLRIKAEPGTPLETLVDMADTVWELNITPNRADCLSHWGVARELAAILERKVRAPKAKVKEKGAAISAQVDNRDTSGCPLYTARVMRGVKVGPSPLWVRLRLEKCGMRSINNVVDATNLVVLELGQPLHAFDLAKLAEGRIVVRRAQAGEPITLLDGKERKLTAEDLVIADAERPVALAGVMGGANSEVSDVSVDLLLESAYFNPVSVRKSSKRHGLHTEASHRFERGVDPAAVELALDRCAQLIIELAGGKIDVGVVKAGPGVPAAAPIQLRQARIGQILGIDVPLKTAKQLLQRIGCRVTAVPGGLEAVPPSWRDDITMEIDLIEEIVRLYGYDKVPSVAPVMTLASAPAAYASRLDDARTWLQDAGFHEMVTYCFIAPEWPEKLGLQGMHAKPITIGNPLTVEQSVMRTMLLPSMLDAAQTNLRRGVPTVKVFDSGRIFLPGTPHEEQLHLGACVFGPWDDSVWAGKERPADFYDLKGVLEGLLRKLGVSVQYRRAQEPFLHPGISAEIMVGETPVGWIGAIHPEVLRNLELPAGFGFELNFDALPVPERQPLQAPSKFPAVMRDVAFLVQGETAVGDVERALLSAAPPELEVVSLFDVYAGESLGGRKNVAFHLRFQAVDRTMNDQEIDAAVAAMVKAVEQQCGGELRAY